MGNQSINIEKVESGATVNIYNQTGSSKKDKETITIAAIDKYSTPLRAEIELTPWGKKHHRVAFLLKNDLIGQVMQQNYLTYDSEKKAREIYSEIIDTLNGFKKEAEEKLIHSAILVPQIWHKMATFESQLPDPPVSKDLGYRYTNPEIHDKFMGAKPEGLVFHDVQNHFPEHAGIIKTANKIKKESKIKHMPNGKWRVTDSTGTKNLGESDTEEGAKKRLREVEYFKHKGEQNWYKLNKQSKLKKVKLFSNTYSYINNKKLQLENQSNNILNSATNINLSIREGRINPNKILKLIQFSDQDTKNDRDIKRECILSLSQLLKTKETPAAIWWIKENSNKVENIIDSFIGVAFDKLAKSDDLVMENFDLLIFDADRTIWDDAIAMLMEPPYEKISEDEIKDKNGEIIKLKPGVKELLINLRRMGKDIGMISKSEKENVNFEDQPVLQLLKLFDIFPLFNETIVISRYLPKSIFIPEDKRVLFIDDDIKNLKDILENTNAKATDSIENIKENIEKTATKIGTCSICGRQNVKLQDDHKTPKWKGGNDKDKKNRQLICEKCHKEKTRSEGSFEEGGKDRHRKLRKNKTEQNYIQYQTDAGKAKIKKERTEMGENAFRQKQKERANKRWKNKSKNKHIKSYINSLKKIYSENKPKESYYELFIWQLPRFFRYAVDQKAEKLANLGEEVHPPKIALDIANNELKNALIDFINKINNTPEDQCPSTDLLNMHFPVAEDSKQPLFSENEYFGETRIIASIFLSDVGSKALQKLEKC